MHIFIDDGSTNIKLQWLEDGKIKRHLSPNSFKRKWAVAFGGQPVFNYSLNGEQYSFDAISPDAETTTDVAYQYDDLNVIAVHHALLTSGLKPQPIDITVSLPISEFYNRENQPNTTNIERKKANLMQAISLKDGTPFTIKSVEVMPESIPAGYAVIKDLDPMQSILIVDLGGTTLDISQVQGKGTGISKIYGNSQIGVSLITGAVKDVLAVAKTDGSAYLADDIIIHRNDDKYLKDRLNDPSHLTLLKKTLEEKQSQLIKLVLRAIDGFKGFSHVMVIGGGAELVADAVKEHCDRPADRFFKSETSQFDLVNGMYEIGQ